MGIWFWSRDAGPGGVVADLICGFVVGCRRSVLLVNVRLHGGGCDVGYAGRGGGDGVRMQKWRGMRQKSEDRMDTGQETERL